MTTDFSFDDIIYAIAEYFKLPLSFERVRGSKHQYKNRFKRKTVSAIF